MLKLATLLENPGEPSSTSRYQDPAVLRELGYTGLVIYETTCLAGTDNPERVVDAELRRWVNNHFEHVTQRIDRAKAAGLAVYLFYDVLVLPRDLVERNISGLTCRGRPTVLCPASEQALEYSAAALDAQLSRWPQIDGIVLRFGDTDAHRFPYLVGNDIYQPHCPRCSQLGRADRIVKVIQRFHDLVVRQRGKRLIVRAWNVRPNGLHDTPELARRVVERLPAAGDDRLVLSFKFTQTDFWRYQRWNAASLVCGDRPILYELQCQREFEGKGGVPNWQVPLWRNGCPEVAEQSEAAGLAQASQRVNIGGLWAWVRGGGWGGPFVKNESWIDANAWAVPRLADDPQADPDELGRQWLAERTAAKDPAIREALLRILQNSPEVIRQGFYVGPAARAKVDSWHPSADWVQDDVLDADAAWRLIQRLPEQKLDEIVAEKQAAAALTSAGRAELQHLVGDRAHRDLEPLVNTLMYAESLYETFRDLLAGLIAYRRYQKSGSSSQADVVRQKLFEAQSHWNHHTQRFGTLPGTATPFRENGFWDRTQTILGEIMK